ncbi:MULTISPECIES: hypothetical protein [unclassified Rhizobium]|uniref:hypothetical protein n=1 Tax=unclassified Rhizobium TaxID=2613769 RepID=UPI0007E9B586|nr:MULTISPECIES: hypothetical protein [unclassified Rhizobium]ANK88688.1 hypothetical protein AMK02_PD00069 [Rhizobium sp. N731]ANL18940.1 hypothetical protein AMJ97_PD00069 [Rhizobium sp. N1314]
MNRSRQSAPITADPSDLGFVDRQIALRQIVDDLRKLRGGAPDDFGRSPALDRLLCVISASVIPIAKADDVDWEIILMELLELRATMTRLATGVAETSH